MIFSLVRLKKIANLSSFSNEEIISAINNLGFEVESTSFLNEIQGIKFGKVHSVEKNPNADNLFVCEIEFYDKQRVIQTRATNVKVGDYVMAFVPGSTNGKVVFDAKKMQGIVSEGMLVSLSELGFDPNILTPEQDGIFTFGPVDLFEDPLKIFELNDILIDVKILSNRADANSYLIMAKELAAYFNTTILPLKSKSATFESEINLISNEFAHLQGLEVRGDYKIQLVDQFLLLKSGFSIHNNPHDLANLVLIYTGQPCQIYSTNQIHHLIEAKLVETKLETSKENTKLLALETNSTLLNFVGQESNSLKNIDSLLFLLPIFDSQLIRNNVRKLKINSLASQQASKGINLGTTALAFEFLTSYLSDFSKPINFKNNFKNSAIAFSIEKIEKFIGQKLDALKIQKTLKALEKLDFEIAQGFFVAPFYRYDIEFFADFCEDFMRFYGYKNLTNSLPAQKPLLVQEPNDLKSKLVAQGFSEISTFVLVSEQENVFNPFELTTNKLQTFVSNEFTEIRYSQAISLSKIASYHLKRKMSLFNFFEIGSIAGEQKSLIFASSNLNFFDLKSKLLSLFSLKFEFKRANKHLHFGKSAFIYLEDSLVGWIGEPHPKYKLANITYCEINLSVLKNLKPSTVKFSDYSNQSLITRDITLSLEPNESIEKYLKKINEIPNIFSVSIKDKVVINNKTKVTLHIICENEAVITLDSIFAEK